MREPWLEEPLVAQPELSSLHATWPPVWQAPLRRYSTVSKFVPLAPQVWMVAVPDTDGVHWKTFSGALPLLAQVPLVVLLPLVVPGNTPPAAGRTVGLVQAAPVPPPPPPPGIVTGVVMTLLLSFS